MVIARRPDQETLAAHVHALEIAQQRLTEAEPEALAGLSATLQALRDAVPHLGLAGLDEALAELTAALATDVERHLPHLLSLLREGLLEGEPQNTLGLMVVTVDVPLQQAVQRHLAAANRALVMVQSVAEAEMLLAERDIALVLLDMTLPGADGREALRRLRQRAPAAQTIIVLDDAAATVPERDCFALGADAYFAKPVPFETLAAMVTGRLQRAAVITRETRRDALTGVPNRAAFCEALERGIAFVSRMKQPLAVAILDLDHFKSVNDTYGHAMGDEVLRRCARMCSQALRRADLFARWGGEEFVVVFPNTDCQAAAQVLERVLQSVGQETFQPAQAAPFHVTFSAGVTDVEPGMAVEEAVAMADRLLYVAKAAGRNRVMTAAAATAAPTHPEAERRQLTVLVCETTATPGAAPLPDACSAVVASFGGHVAVASAQRLVAYFGYPRVYEDNAPRAVHAGLALRSLLAPGAAGEATLGVGIHTGMDIVQAEPEGASAEQDLFDDLAQVARQLASRAQQGAVVLSAATYQLIQEWFVCQPLATAAVAYEVLQPRSRLDDDGGPAALTPLVGREREMALLAERWEYVKDGMGQVLLLSGEAGIGKSRLIPAMRERLADDPHVTLRGYGSPYHQHSAFYPVIELLQHLCRFADGDTPEVRRGKLEEQLEALQLGNLDAVTVLAALLSIPLSDAAASTLTPQRQRQKTLETLLALVLALSAQQPVALIVEDLQWLDPSTQEFLDLLVEQAPMIPLLLLGTCRLTFQVPWLGREHVTQSTIGRLPQVQIEHLVMHLTNGKGLPPAVLQHLVEKTDGVPLFVEELTKMILESGLLQEQSDHYALTGPLPPLAIPATLHDSLMARLDRPGAVKAVAQLAATLGRSFPYDLLQAVSRLDEPTLAEALVGLVESALLYRRGVPPHATYTFKHALIQDIAYQSLLPGTRQQYHARVAQTLVADFPDVVSIQAELVAHHYTAAGMYAEAVPHWARAGQHASERSAGAEAIVHLNRGLALLDRLPETPERSQQELDLQMLLGAMLIAAKSPAAPEIELVYARARQLSREVGATPELLWALEGQWGFYLVRGQFDIAYELGEQLLDLSQHLRHASGIVAARKALGLTCFYRGDLRQAQSHFDAGLAANAKREIRISQVRGVQEPGVMCLAFSTLTQCLQGDPAQALQRNRRMLDGARELAHLFTLTFAHCAAAVLHQCRGDLRATQEQAETAIDLATEYGFPMWLAMGSVLHGWSLATQGQTADGIRQLRRGVNIWRQAGAQNVLPYFLLLLTDAYRADGQPEAGQQSLDDMRAVVQVTGERLWDAEAHRLQGELLLLGATPEANRAAQCFHLARQRAHQQAAKLWELRAVISLVRSEPAPAVQARQLLAETLEQFPPGHDAPDLQDAHALLDGITTPQTPQPTGERDDAP